MRDSSRRRLLRQISSETCSMMIKSDRRWKKQTNVLINGVSKQFIDTNESRESESVYLRAMLEKRESILK